MGKERKKKIFFLTLICSAFFASGAMFHGFPAAGAARERALSAQQQDNASYSKQVAAFRKQKDEFFRMYRNSPIPEKERHSFKGLCYYPPDPAFRVTGTFKRYEKRQKRGEWMFAIGTFAFELQGRRLELEVWQSEDSARMTVLFTDPTNGKETYEAGRYVELEPGEKGAYVLDFNYAYNPYCHYNHNYVCPLPPPENRLPVSITAGEKK